MTRDERWEVSEALRFLQSARGNLAGQRWEMVDVELKVAIAALSRVLASPLGAQEPERGLKQVAMHVASAFEWLTEERIVAQGPGTVSTSLHPRQALTPREIGQAAEALAHAQDMLAKVRGELERVDTPSLAVREAAQALLDNVGKTVDGEITVPFYYYTHLRRALAPGAGA